MQDPRGLLPDIEQKLRMAGLVTYTKDSSAQ